MGIEKIVAESGLFDDIFYIKTYRDVRLSSLTPLEHYCRHGVAEDRKPNAEFDPSWYREYYADVKEAGVYPFLHFLESGRAENRFQNEAEKEEYENSKFKVNDREQKFDTNQLLVSILCRTYNHVDFISKTLD
ncbi:MAG: hypothetical protein QG565_328, partial [Campylobacterota bacterium]|nr:hypothetical protein [Campylobacterota bacterium]